MVIIQGGKIIFGPLVNLSFALNLVSSIIKSGPNPVSITMKLNSKWLTIDNEEEWYEGLIHLVNSLCL
jgi:hypothetical protein